MRLGAQINNTEKTLLEMIDSRTLLLKSCVMSSYFESTISDCSVASILYTLCLKLFFESLDMCMKLTPVS